LHVSLGTIVRLKNRNAEIMKASDPTPASAAHASENTDEETMAGPSTSENCGTRESLLRDSQWALRELERTGFAEWPGDYVAVFEQHVVGSGDNERELRDKASRQIGAAPGRIIIEYKGPLE
jgi:hypothetical protein